MTKHRDERPEIDYLAKDFTSFRQLMLDHLAVLVPNWSEEHPADMAQAVVDVLAYVADYLSYYQDAVATETYLSTARLRVSVRRHTRLLDYPLDEGCNARVWVQIPALALDAGEGILVPRGTQLLTRVANEQETMCLLPEDPAVVDLTNRGALVFETMHDVWIYPELNRISFFIPQGYAPILDANTNSVMLRDELIADGGRQKLARLAVGDVLVFESIRDQQTGRLLPEGGDPVHRHVVRLTDVIRTKAPDETGALVPVVRVAWATDDALSSPLVLTRRDAAGRSVDVSVARGNIVLADHGRTIRNEALPEVPAIGRYYPPLLRRGLTFRAPFDPIGSRQQPASQALIQDPGAILPAIKLVELGTDTTTPTQVPIMVAAQAGPHGAGPLRLAPAPDSAAPAPVSALIKMVDEHGVTVTRGLELPAGSPAAMPPLPDLAAAAVDALKAGTVRLQLAPIMPTTMPGDAEGDDDDEDAEGGQEPGVGAGLRARPGAGPEIRPFVVKPWQARAELMATGERTREFVVEVEDDGRTLLRFGFGDTGWEPTAVGAPFRATYRVGIGAAGNVGPNAIRHIVTGRRDLQRMFAISRGLPKDQALQIRNFLPAVGGRDPASVDMARLEAPSALPAQERCVTAVDYADRATQYVDVAQAIALMRTVGSWQAVFIYVRRNQGRAVDPTYRRELQRFMQRYRLTGHQIEVRGPRLVPLQVEIDVYLQPGHHATQAAQPLRDALGWTCQPDGTPPFFDPDDFSFGKTIYRSRMVYRAVQVPGVGRVEVRAFCRLGDDPAGEEIVLQPVEVAHLDILRIDWLGLPSGDAQRLPALPAGRMLFSERFQPSGAEDPADAEDSLTGTADTDLALAAGGQDALSSSAGFDPAGTGPAGPSSGASTSQLPVTSSTVEGLAPDQGTLLIHLWGLL
jgi:predicted phage baseplate assembly protein